MATGTVSLDIVQTVGELGGVQLSIEQTVSESGSVFLGLTQAISDSGPAALSFNQIVSELGGASVALEQIVQYPVGNASLSLRQSVAQVGSASLSFSQNVYTPDFVAAGWTNWDISVRAGGIDVSDDLTGTLTIDAERSSARVAQFTLLMAGIIEQAEWVGRSVSVDYIQGNGAVWRRFTGVIERAEYDISAKTLRCICTDDLQKVVDGHSNEQLSELIGGYWDAGVFRDGNTGWDYMNDLLKTAFKSVELNSNRVLTVSDRNNKAASDYTFDDSLILDNSLSVNLVQRNQLVNRVDVEFGVRYQRIHHLETRFSWNYTRSFCDEYAQPVLIPTQNLVGEAIEHAGWTLVGGNYYPWWQSGIYSCNGRQSAFNNRFKDGIRGFYVTAAKRWRQTVTENYNVTLRALDSIDKYGELSRKDSGSLSAESSFNDWGGDEDDFSSLPAGFVYAGGGHYRYDDIDNADVYGAFNSRIAKALVEVLESHQQNAVTFQLPLSPYIELGQTIEIDDPGVACKGIIHRFSENYDFNAGRPVTEIELALSFGASGLDIVEAAVSAPNRPKLEAADPGDLPGSLYLPTHIGGIAGAAQENEDWFGMILNADTPTPGTPVYTAALKIPVSGVDAQLTDSIELELPYEFNVAVPDNLLTITA